MNTSAIQIFTTKDGKTEIEVKLDRETVWLSLNHMVELFERDKSLISRHINNTYKEKELTREATVAKYATVQNEGERIVEREMDFYNLDVIISVGYRIKSKRGTQFRIWANQVLKEYLIQGYSINEKRLQHKTEQLEELRKSVKLLGQVLNYK
jgi:hypothetical protein